MLAILVDLLLLLLRGLQVGGQLERWQLYHSTHLVERCIRALKSPPGATSHPMAPHAGTAPCPASALSCFALSVPSKVAPALTEAPLRLPPPPAPCRPLPPPAAEWYLPQMMRVVACLHAYYTPAGRQAMAAVAAALDLSPQERALYLRKGPLPKAGAAKVRCCAVVWVPGCGARRGCRHEESTPDACMS